MGNCALSDGEVDKLRPPTSYGGCGVSSALRLAQPVSIASIFQNLVLQCTLLGLTGIDNVPRAKLISVLNRHQTDIPARFHVTVTTL